MPMISVTLRDDSLMPSIASVTRDTDLLQKAWTEMNVGVSMHVSL
ncbi:hypothetical protein [Paraburkholderia sp. MM5477-R1]